MKVFAILFFAAMALSAQAHLSDEQKAKLKTYYQECVDSTGVDKELIIKARKGEFTEDDHLMSYYHCMMKKMGFQDADGTLHKDVMIAKLPSTVDAAKGKEVIDKCAVSPAGASKERVSYDIFKCFIESVGNDVKFL